MGTTSSQKQPPSVQTSSTIQSLKPTVQRGAYLKRKPVSALDDDYDRLFPATASSQKASGTSAISENN